MIDENSAGADGRGAQPSSQPPGQEPGRPWRTEGLPDRGDRDDRDRGRWREWLPATLWMVAGFLLLFAGVTVQDSQSQLSTVSYTEFKQEVQAGNVAEVFSRGETIQGVLRQPSPSPDRPGQLYQRFSTVRPAFAGDDLLAELQRTGVVVRATPVEEHRGLLANLLISVAPFLLLVLFYLWLFRRQQQFMGGGLLGGGRRKPVDPETVRVTFDDVAGIDEVEEEISEVVDFLRDPDSPTQSVGS